MPNYKLVDSDKLNSDLTIVADAIRAKGGTADALLFPGGMKTTIENIKTGAELNIAYGDTAPEDTSKLWVKTSEPSGVIVTSDAEYVVSGAEGIDTMSAVLPTPLMNSGSATVGNKVYIFGGMIDSTKTTTNAIHCFDLEAKTVTTLPVTLDTNLHGMGCASVGTKIYIIGGQISNNLATSTDIVRCFDTETQTLTTCTATLSTVLYLHTCVAYNEKVYIFGGRMRWGDNNNNVFCYDTKADAITTVVSFTVGFNNMVTQKGNIVYFLSTVLKQFDLDALVGNTVSVTWGKPGYGLSAGSSIACIGNYLYIFDYNTAFGAPCHRIDLRQSSFTGELLDFSCDGLARYSDVETFGEEVYFLGGYVGSEVPQDKILRYSKEKYSPAVSTDGLLLEVKNGKTAVPIINTEAAKIEVGIGGAYKGNANGIGEKVEAALYKDNTWTNI